MPPLCPQALPQALTIAGTVTRQSDATAIAGALVEALQAGVVKGANTTAANGTYTIGNLTAGTYDVRVSATGFVIALSTGKTVSAGATTTVNVALVVSPGTLTGKVIQPDAVTAISGATVKVYQGSTLAGTATTNGTGDYTITNHQRHQSVANSEPTEASASAPRRAGQRADTSHCARLS